MERPTKNGDHDLVRWFVAIGIAGAGGMAGYSYLDRADPTALLIVGPFLLLAGVLIVWIIQRNLERKRRGAVAEGPQHRWTRLLGAVAFMVGVIAAIFALGIRLPWLALVLFGVGLGLCVLLERQARAGSRGETTSP